MEAGCLVRRALSDRLLCLKSNGHPERGPDALFGLHPDCHDVFGGRRFQHRAQGV
jgi:hypothetical protein